MLDEKYQAELNYWRERYRIEGVLGNSHYKDMMLAIAGKDESYFSGKTIADFGCGPRGSLEWAAKYAQCYCIDVLVEEYKDLGIERHKAHYVKSSESHIPLDSATVDVIFSINSLDHASNWKAMLDECIRILKPGGLMAMSINIDEPPSPAEPNTLTVAEIMELLGDHITVERQMTSNRSSGSNKYLYLMNWARTGETPPAYNGHWGMLWLSGTKV